MQTFGSLAHIHPHLHVLLTDGAYRRDGTFVPAPGHDAAVLEEVWRRAVLQGFVERGWLDEDAAQAMLAWPHSGFGAHVGPRLAVDDRAGLLRVARYAARAPVAESRRRYDAGRAEVELVSDAHDGPYVGVHRMTALEFLARWADHVGAGARAGSGAGCGRAGGGVAGAAGAEAALGRASETGIRGGR